MYEDYTIKQFENAWFKNDYSELSKDNFDIVYNEYVDTAGLYEAEEFERVTYIHYLNGRINSIKLSIALQKEFIELFDTPYLDFSVFSKFGHSLKWKDKKDFISQLDKVELKEKKFISQLEIKKKELLDSRKKKIAKEVTIKQTRESFVRTLISLRKIGYKIDNFKTTVEELALVIKQQKYSETS